MILLSQSFNAIFKQYHPRKSVLVQQAVEAEGNHSRGHIYYNSTILSVILLLYNIYINC